MGKVDLAPSGKFQVVLDGPAEAAAMRAATRLVPDPDPMEIPAKGGTIVVDPDHVSNVLVLWAAGLQWSQPALQRAIDELAPYALQSTAIHSASTLKSQQRMMRRFEGLRRDTPPGKE
jgi:hypothetical protein